MLVLPKLKIKSSPNFSARTAKIDLLVLHDMEGSYGSGINTLTQPKSPSHPNPVSSHLALREDGLEAALLVPFDKKAWHAEKFNSRSIGTEMAGFKAKGFSDAEWQAAANIFAYLLHKFGIPCRWAEKGVGAGFCRHFDLGAAGGGHSDPTTDPAVWAAFIKRVEAAYALPAPATW